MARKIGFWLLWFVFIGYAFLLAPADQSNTLSLIKQLSTGQWADINSLIVSLFNLMGIWPMVYGTIVLTDGRSQKIPAWPFWAASFGFGAFAILPYLALREPAPRFSGELDRNLKFWNSRGLGVALGVGAIALLLYGFTQGNWNDFVQQWQTSRFIHVMSLDFCLLSLLFSALIADDLARRDMAWQWGLIALVPLLGPIVYTVLRSPLDTQDNLMS